MNPKKCKDCLLEFVPFKFAQPRCMSCALLLAKSKREAKVNRDRIALQREEKAKHRKAKLEYRREDRLEILQKLVNRYVVQVRDKDKPCYTCGTRKETIKYDGGHFFTRKARPDIRFELLNIHKQCSVDCNQHGSGMRNEYEAHFIHDYGIEALEELKREKPLLKVQFPDAESIEIEIKKWRKLLRDNNVIPKY